MGLILEIITGASLLASSLIAVWMVGAIYYDMCGGAKWARWVALAWAVGVIAVLAAWRPLWQPIVALLGAEFLFLVWWFRLEPTNDREWDPNAAVLPRAVRADDAVTIENVRNLEYHSLDDSTPRYEARTYHLSSIKGVDVIFFDWGNGFLGHPALIFDFGPDGRICMSIEARLPKGQKYSVVRSLYRQQELIFVAADERDVILRRTKYSQGQWAYLYHLNSTVVELTEVFLDYVNTINQLYESPRWYHVLFTNCTTSFYKLPSTRVRWDWRVIANARLDRALYNDGRLDRTLPFKELRRLACLNDIADTAPASGFGDHIRRELERRRHER
ncbi:MAG: DUF4105 domain-containing protein [Paludisphaera borealis]|uniref:lipoprotein N-acyltransferase Lnb domain-containing protein n=1 Tax=Paludisphaera borealis TaxID=1387353 RepID=UPI00285153B5|nr:DUF4105 domain-containing protein [Paludisphaera borealis]MDR3621461.1 DUF4105 domain-containing protein [Paludisphaera borealis]